MAKGNVPWWVHKKQRARARQAVNAQSLAMVGMRPKRTRVYSSREARRGLKNDPLMMMKRRRPPTRRSAPPMVTKQAPEYMRRSESAYLNGSVLPEYAALNTNMLKLGQQHLPFGMKARTIDAPDHY